MGRYGEEWAWHLTTRTPHVLIVDGFVPDWVKNVNHGDGVNEALFAVTRQSGW